MRHAHQIVYIVLDLLAGLVLQGLGQVGYGFLELFVLVVGQSAPVVREGVGFVQG